MPLSFKANKSVASNAIPVDIVNKYTVEILDSVLYDTEKCLVLEQFETVKVNTHCIFAKTAKLWGSRDYDIALSLEENVRRLAMCLPRLSDCMIMRSGDVGR